MPKSKAIIFNLFFVDFLKPVSFFQVLKPFHLYIFFVVTSFAKSNPFKPGHLVESFINFLILKFPFLLAEIFKLSLLTVLYPQIKRLNKII